MAEKKVKTPLSEELRRYGYVFEMKKSMLMYLAAAGTAVALGCFFSLGAVEIAVLGIWIGAFLPFFVRNAYKNKYEQQRFSDAGIYMEQFLYSFQKSAKVLATLENMMQLFEEGPMREAVAKAREYILHTFQGEQVEQQALKIIEDEYPAHQIVTMHRFALQVEKNGGEYTQSILLMLEIRRMWTDRIYQLMNARKKQRFQIFLSIAASLLLCSMISLLSGSLGICIGEMPLTRVVTLSVLMADFYIFYRADRKLSAEILSEENEKDKDFLWQYRILRKEKRRDPIHVLQRRIAFRNVSRELEKEFPKWLMQVSLLLQSENVQVAIFRSYGDAPKILKPELKQMMKALEKHPADIAPYLNFLKDFPLPEVRSSMKMLYSLSEGTGGDASFQIADIIRRNQVMLDKAQKMKNEDALAGMYALFLAPQLTGGVKIVIDMLVLLVSYLGSYGLGG